MADAGHVKKPNKPPAFQFYAVDFLQGTRLMSLSECGAYIRFLAHSWDSGPLPVDERLRARILGVSVPMLRRLWGAMEDKWVEVDGGFINRRLEHQRFALEDFRRRQSARGKLSATARANRTSTSVQPALEPDPQPEVQPNANSSVSDLQSSGDPVQRTNGISQTRAREVNAPVWRPPGPVHGHSLIDGSAARLHGQHAWCATRDGLCVPRFLHQEFLGKLAQSRTERQLFAWYLQTVDDFQGQAIGDDTLRFWRNAFAQWVGTVTVMPGNRESTAAYTTRSAREVLNAIEDADKRLKP